MLDGTLIWFEHGLNGLTRTVLLAKQKSEKSVLSVFYRKKVCV